MVEQPCRKDSHFSHSLHSTWLERPPEWPERQWVPVGGERERGGRSGRRWVRRAVKLSAIYWRLTGKGAGHLIEETESESGEVVDLSGAGAFVRVTDEVPQVGTRLRIRIHLPEGRPFEVLARVVRVTQDGMGLRFERFLEGYVDLGDYMATLRRGEQKVMRSEGRIDVSFGSTDLEFQGVLLDLDQQGGRIAGYLPPGWERLYVRFNWPQLEEGRSLQMVVRVIDSEKGKREFSFQIEQSSSGLDSVVQWFRQQAARPFSLKRKGAFLARLWRGFQR